MLVIGSTATATTATTGGLSIAGTAAQTGLASGDSPSSNSNSGSSSSSDSGDSVSISAEARSLAAEAAASKSSGETTVDKIKKMIKDIQQQIKQAQEDPRLTKDERTTKVQLLQAQLLVLENELAREQSSSGSYKGGTPAQGMGSSLT